MPRRSLVRHRSCRPLNKRSWSARAVDWPGPGSCSWPPRVLENQEIARQPSLSVQIGSKWRKRYFEEGVADLAERSRIGPRERRGDLPAARARPFRDPC